MRQSSDLRYELRGTVHREIYYTKTTDLFLSQTQGATYNCVVMVQYTLAPEPN